MQQSKSTFVLPLQPSPEGDRHPFYGVHTEGTGNRVHEQRLGSNRTPQHRVYRVQPQTLALVLVSLAPYPPPFPGPRWERYLGQIVDGFIFRMHRYWPNTVCVWLPVLFLTHLYSIGSPREEVGKGLSFIKHTPTNCSPTLSGLPVVVIPSWYTYVMRVSTTATAAATITIICTSS